MEMDMVSLATGAGISALITWAVKAAIDWMRFPARQKIEALERAMHEQAQENRQDRAEDREKIEAVIENNTAAVRELTGYIREHDGRLVRIEEWMRLHEAQGARG